MKTVVWWIRRDLRVDNNLTLQSALDRGLPVLPLFIIDPQLWQEPASRRQVFLNHGLAFLAEKIRSLGNQLIIQHGQPIEVLTRLCATYDIQAVFAEEDYSPYAMHRDSEIQQLVPLELICGVVLHHPETILKRDGSPYKVFTPFRNAWRGLSAPPFAPKQVFNIPQPTIEIESHPLPAAPTDLHFPPGENEGRQRLQNFVAGPIFQYNEGRNRLDKSGTSMLSPYLRFGMISIAETYESAKKAEMNAATAAERDSVQTWISELIWREFYVHTLYHFPAVLKQAFQDKRRSIHWRSAPDDLLAWQKGQTGYPIVDACMRQLEALGWMHNRGRMIVASFLVKDLLINWQEGEDWFMQNLVDGDPAANNGGWQWTAGVGLDAAPYFRIFNPVLQSKKFDPQAHFIRQWIPELTAVPNSYIHAPWLTPVEIQKECGCRIGIHYPAPIVDHQLAKKRVMLAFQ